MANKITTLLEFDTRGGVRSIGQLRTELKNTEGAFNKMKVGAKGAGQFLQANIAEGALAAGAAIVGFGVKAVQAFTDTALAAGKFADATGLAVEDASRWTEVADDIGVSGETLTGLFTRLNKAIGSNAPAVKELGIELKRTADGSADVNATMLSAIEAINQIADPTERAKRAQELFGRGYAEASELIFDSAENVRRKLGEVSEAKVINEDELAKARKLRESMDNLRDAVEDVALMFGEKLAPSVAETADNLVFLKDQADRLGSMGGGALGEVADAAESAINPLSQLNDAVSGLREQFGGGSDDVEDYTEELSAMADADKRATTASNEVRAAQEQANEEIELAGMYAEYAAGRIEGMAQAEEAAAEAADELADKAGQLADALDRQRENAQNAADAMRDQADAVHDLYGAEASLEDAIAKANEVMEEIANGEFEGSQRDAREAVIDVARAADEQAEALLATKGLTMDSVTGQREWIDSMLDSARTLSGPLRQEVLNHISRVTGIPTDILTKFGVEMDAAALARIQADLDNAARTRFVRFSPTGTAGGARIDGGDTGPRARTGIGATGGIVTQATRAIIGEAGPEAVIPLNQMPGASPLPSGGGGPVTIHIHAMGTTPELERVVANALAKYNQRNGR